MILIRGEGRGGFDLLFQSFAKIAKRAILAFLGKISPSRPSTSTISTTHDTKIINFALNEMFHTFLITLLVASSTAAFDHNACAEWAESCAYGCSECPDDQSCGCTYFTTHALTHGGWGYGYEGTIDTPTRSCTFPARPSQSP